MTNIANPKSIKTKSFIVLDTTNPKIYLTSVFDISPSINGTKTIPNKRKRSENEYFDVLFIFNYCEIL